jgi:hypothetical protein
MTQSNVSTSFGFVRQCMVPLGRQGCNPARHTVSLLLKSVAVVIGHCLEVLRNSCNGGKYGDVSMVCPSGSVTHDAVSRPAWTQQLLINAVGIALCDVMWRDGRWIRRSIHAWKHLSSDYRSQPAPNQS